MGLCVGESELLNGMLEAAWRTIPNFIAKSYVLVAVRARTVICLQYFTVMMSWGALSSTRCSDRFEDWRTLFHWTQAIAFDCTLVHIFWHSRNW